MKIEKFNEKLYEKDYDIYYKYFSEKFGSEKTEIEKNDGEIEIHLKFYTIRNVTIENLINDINEFNKIKKNEDFRFYINPMNNNYLVIDIYSVPIKYLNKIKLNNAANKFNL